MAKPGDHQKATDDSFGAHLARLRNAAGLTLRQVEEATDEEVSNAYLSQLEKNKIAKTSPWKSASEANTLASRSNRSVISASRVFSQSWMSA